MVKNSDPNPTSWLQFLLAMLGSLFTSYHFYIGLVGGGVILTVISSVCKTLCLSHGIFCG
jgi:hypothetical protein